MTTFDESMAAWHAGYECGVQRRELATWQLDNERWDVARRVEAVTMDKGSYGNLSALCEAVYQPKYGWTSDECARLRYELVRLLGGGSDVVEGSGVDSDSAPVRVGVHEGAVVGYDVLSNERHKAVCGLRKMPDWYPADAAHPSSMQFEEDLYRAIGVEGLPSFAKARDRLIHLLGGDEPTAMEYIQRIVREHDKICLDMKPSGTELSQASAEATSGRADQPQAPVSMGQENETDGTCPNDVPIASITDELRKWASDRHCKGISHTDALNVGLIADRIDGDVAELRHDAEIWYDRAEELRKERDDAERERDMWRVKLLQLTDVVDRYVGRYEDVLELLRDAARDYQSVDSWAQVWHGCADSLNELCDELLRERNREV